MQSGKVTSFGRRELLAGAVPACAVSCLGLWKMPHFLAGSVAAGNQEQHKFDIPRQVSMSRRDQWERSWGNLVDFLTILRIQQSDEEILPFLNTMSEGRGRALGERQSRQFPDTEFATFVDQFRPPRFEEMLTHEVVVDTDTVFELRVTECINATCFRDEGLGGEIGHACVCNMDYSWPTGFNPRFKMERTKTLMRGDDCCNHRYLASA